MLNGLNKRRKKVYAVTILFIVLSLIPLIFNGNLWGDEIATMRALDLSWKGLFFDLCGGADAHPPFYYFGAKLWTVIFGGSVTSLKLFSILPLVLNMILGATIVDKYFGKEDVKVPLGFILMHFCGFHFISFALEVRMYTWALYFVTYSALLAYTIVKEGINLNRTIWFLCISLLGAYTHYFALVSIAMIYGYLFLFLCIQNKKNIKYCIQISVLTIIAYLPGVYMFVQQNKRINGGFWMEDVTIKAFIKYIIYPFQGQSWSIMIISGLAFGLCALMALYKLLQKEKCGDIIEAIIFISIFFLTVAVAIIVGFLYNSVYINRYGFPCFALLWLGVLLFCKKVIDKPYVWTIMGIIMLWAGVTEYHSEYLDAHNNGIGVVQEYITEVNNEEAIMMMDSGNIAMMFRYYYSDVEFGFFSVVEDFYVETDEVIYYFTEKEHLPCDTKLLDDQGVAFELVMDVSLDMYETKIFKIYKK